MLKLMNLNKKSFMFIEITVFPKKYLKFNSETLIKKTKDIAVTAISVVQKNNFKFNFQIISQIYDRLGKNRQIIDLEIEKLSTYLDREKEIKIEIIEHLFGQSAELSSNDFIFSSFLNCCIA